MQNKPKERKQYSKSYWKSNTKRWNGDTPRSQIFQAKKKEVHRYRSFYEVHPYILHTWRMMYVRPQLLQPFRYKGRGTKEVRVRNERESRTETSESSLTTCCWRCSWKPERICWQGMKVGACFFSCIAERARGMVGQLSRNAKAKKGERGINCRSLSTGLESNWCTPWEGNPDGHALDIDPGWVSGRYHCVADAAYWIMNQRSCLTRTLNLCWHLGFGYCHCTGNCSTVPPATDQVQHLKELEVALAVKIIWKENKEQRRKRKYHDGTPHSKDRGGFTQWFGSCSFPYETWWSKWKPYFKPIVLKLPSLVRRLGNKVHMSDEWPYISGNTWPSFWLRLSLNSFKKSSHTLPKVWWMRQMQHYSRRSSGSKPSTQSCCVPPAVLERWERRSNNGHPMAWSRSSASPLMEQLHRSMAVEKLQMQDLKRWLDEAAG